MLFLLYFERSGKLFFRGRFVLQEISFRLKSGEHFVLRIIEVLTENYRRLRDVPDHLIVTLLEYRGYTGRLIKSEN